MAGTTLFDQGTLPGVQAYDWGATPSYFAGAGEAAPGTTSMPTADFLRGLGGTGKGLDSGLGLNIGTGQLALGGLSTVANLWSAFQAQNLAKQQFNFTKDFANANLANQIKSYNTRLEDKFNSRAVLQGEAPGWAQGQIDRNKMAR